MKKGVIGLLAILIIIPAIVFAVLVLDGTTFYSSTDTNVTQETGFAHLNISDGDLVLYMPFDYNHSSGIVYDYSNNSNDGTMIDFASNYTVDGVYGGAYTLDGSDDYINLPYINLSNSLTYSMWFKREGTGNQQLFAFMKTLLRVGNTSIYYWSDMDLAATSNPWSQNSNWNYIAITQEGTNCVIYLNNNTLIDSETCDPIDATSSYHYIGRWGADRFNGSVDEVMIFNRSLNSTEVLAIYNNQSSRFYSTGEMLFTGNNLGTNNTVNISLANCGTLKGSYLQAKINNGDYVNFSSCNITNYPVQGSLSSANLTIKFNPDSYGFYSSSIVGNITLYGLDNQSSIVTIISPTNGSTSTSSSVSISVTTNENSTCNYSVNSGTSNSSLTSNATGTGHTGIKTALSNGDYTLNVYCADLNGNANNSVSVAFTVAVPAAATEETITTSGTGSKIYTASSSSLEEGYSVKLAKNQKVELNLGNGGKVVEVKSITSDKVVLDIGGKEYSFPKNSSAKFDLDNDGTYDLEIKNNNIIGRFADMEFRLISEEVAFDEQQEQQSNVGEAIKNVEWYFYVIIGVVIILIVVGIVLKKKRRNV